MEQAAGQFAEDDFVIAQVGEQEQDEGAAVLFLSNGAGGGEAAEERDQGELQLGVKLEEQGSEAGGVAKGRGLAPADQGLPGGEARAPRAGRRRRRGGRSAAAGEAASTIPGQRSDPTRPPRLSRPPEFGRARLPPSRRPPYRSPILSSRIWP